VLLLLILTFIQNEVVELSDGNMDDFLIEHPKTLVMFHADWCTHCKSFMKPYGKLSE
jgi:thiol-disulfide isomerase/thioredoxin